MDTDTALRLLLDVLGITPRDLVMSRAKLESGSTAERREIIMGWLDKATPLPAQE